MIRRDLIGFPTLANLPFTCDESCTTKARQFKCRPLFTRNRIRELHSGQTNQVPNSKRITMRNRWIGKFDVLDIRGVMTLTKRVGYKQWLHGHSSYNGCVYKALWIEEFVGFRLSEVITPHESGTEQSGHSILYNTTTYDNSQKSSSNRRYYRNYNRDLGFRCKMARYDKSVYINLASTMESSFAIRFPSNLTRASWYGYSDDKSHQKRWYKNRIWFVGIL